MQASRVNTTPLAPSELAAWRGLLRAHGALVHDLDAELRAAHDLSLHEYEVLLVLGEAPGQPDADVRPREPPSCSARAG